MVQENWTFVQALSWGTIDGPDTPRAHRRSPAEAAILALTALGHMGSFQPVNSSSGLFSRRLDRDFRR